MKKSIIALSVLSVLSINFANAASSIEHQVKENKADIDFIYDVTHRQDQDIMKLEYEATQSRNDINQINSNFEAMSDIVESHQESLINLESVTNNLHKSGEMEAARLEKRIDEVASNGYDDAELRSEGREFVNTRLQSLDSSVQSRMQDLSTDVDTRLNSAYTSGADEAARLDKRIDAINTDKFDDAELRSEGREFVNTRLQSLDSSVQSRMQDLSTDVDARLNSAYTSGADEAARLDKRIDAINTDKFDDAELRSEGREFVNTRLQSLDSSVQSRMQDLSTDVDARLNSAYTSGADEAARLDKRIDRINRDGYDDTQLRREASEYAAHVDKDVDNLFKGVSQNFHAITDLKLEHEVLADKGKVAYDSLRADGEREVAKLESVVNGAQRTGEIERARMNNAIRKDAEQALSGLSKGVDSRMNHLANSGADEAARLDKRIDDISFDDSTIRKDAEQALSGLSKGVDSRMNHLANSGADEAARLDKRIDEVAEKGYDDSQIREDGQAAYEDALAKGEHAYKDLAEKGQEYVDGKFNKLDVDFKETQQAMVVVQNQARQNYEHIGENRQRIADNAAAIEEAKNSGGAAITDADLKAARAEAKQIANNAANKAIEDAVSNVEIDADTAKAVEAEVAKVAEKVIADAVSKVDTDAALKEFFDTLNKQDRAIRGDGAAQVARLDGRIDANTKAIEENTKKIEALENRIDGFQDYMNENAAMTNALSGLPQPYGVGKVQVGVGLGFASDKKAVAIGMGYRATDAVVIRAGISKSAGSRGDVQGNVAVGYEF
ncbi:YadA C-terminal domain-containing protein [Shewanella sp. MBTL60-007]|uniref:YadA C-terminal domain-containing protein n=1 Tax=Shewanella sp. MBTL60-007 TaxID=2815911 RepID=UPI001BC798BD|nr:YadA C-terminal domain-containing protein [Shewanella sp. MBTL60-007]GIU28884.1 hypothetical protein TUM3792_38080 [Shewanella sp. MBTL60-007]